MSKKVLITGGAGFIGSNLVEELLKKDYEITVLDNFSSGYLKNLEEFEDEIEIIQGDIRDKNLIENLVEGTCGVFHLAAMVSVPESVEKPVECFEINTIGTMNIINACIENNSKFIFASSAAIYGQDETQIKTEDLHTTPISPYGISKKDTETLCEIYSKEKGLKYSCFRNFNVYGPKQDTTSAYAAVIPRFIEFCLKEEEIKIFGTGEQTRDFIYVKDVVFAYLEALESEVQGVFNLGCNEILNLKELADLIKEKTSSNSQITHLKPRKGDIIHSRASSEKYQTESSWSPKTSLNDGIDKTIEYYKGVFN